jgi:hypothetical protein
MSKPLTRLHLRRDPVPAWPTPAKVLLAEIGDELRARP